MQGAEVPLLNFFLFASVCAFALSPAEDLEKKRESAIQQLQINLDATYESLAAPFVHASNEQELEAFLDAFKLRTDFPSIPNPEEKPSPHLTSMRISARGALLFTEVEQEIFGRTGVFTLYPAMGFAAAFLEAKTIAISPSLLQVLGQPNTPWQGAVRFIMAHELSHYLLEMKIRESGGLSWNGYRSRRTMVRPEDSKSAREFLIHSGLRSGAHAEVDALAALILQRMGFDKQTIFEAFLLGIDLDRGMGKNRRIPPTLSVRFSTQTTLRDLQSIGMGLEGEERTLPHFEDIIRALSLQRTLFSTELSML